MVPLVSYCKGIAIFSGISNNTSYVSRVTQHDVLRHCFFPLFWCSLNGLQLFLRLEVSQKRPEASACWSHSSNSSSSFIISASKSQRNLLEFDLWVLSNPTTFTWKLGRWVLGLHAIPWLQYTKAVRFSLFRSMEISSKAVHGDINIHFVRFIMFHSLIQGSWQKGGKNSLKIEGSEKKSIRSKDLMSFDTGQ